jgi:hypothetical protein
MKRWKRQAKLGCGWGCAGAPRAGRAQDVGRRAPLLPGCCAAENSLS